MKDTFDIFKLTQSFYDAYPNDLYPEMLYKQSRAYNCLLVNTKDYIIAIPFRTHIHHKNAFHFTTSERSKSNASGLDYSKSLIISDTDYLESTGYSIDQDEYKEVAVNFERIKQQALEYVENYISHFETKPMDKNAFRMKYAFTTLKYFHEVLGINGSQSMD